MDKERDANRLAAPQALYRANLLNINDDDGIRYALSRMLTAAGFTVVEAVNGTEGLALAGDAPDLILLDVQLPDIDGFQVCSTLRSNPDTAFIPVLMISATFVLSRDKAAGMDSGADAYLTNPVEPAELVAAVNALLRMKRAEEAARSAAREWEATFSAMSDSICVLDKDGILLRCNSSLANLLGRSATDLIGQSFRSVAPEAFVELAFSAEAAALGNERRIVQVSHGSRLFRVTSDQIKDKSGKSIATVHIFSDTTDLKEAERQNADLLAQVQAAGAKQRTFLREVLSSITEGHLCLCETDSDLPGPLAGDSIAVDLKADSLAALRRGVEHAARDLGFADSRVQDLVTASSEAGMNAFVHGGGGKAHVRTDKKNTLQVWIEDSGKGIPIDSIHEATLNRGYTTTGTLGHGFWLMLRTTDRIYLLTGEHGTTIVLEQSSTPSPNIPAISA